MDRLTAGAQKNLEPGEAIREVVQVQTGRSAGANATAVEVAALTASDGFPYRPAGRPVPHVLVATDQNLYAMKLSGARLLDVGEVVLKVPLDQVRLRHEKDRLEFGGSTFHVMALFGDHAKRLSEYVPGP